MTSNGAIKEKLLCLIRGVNYVKNLRIIFLPYKMNAFNTLNR
ncbi:hypothetical protein LEP1GSC199_1539 [Leptospira vanthielii serovar Holland str. Waz Holland = ATCC 700522]|uniref:Uncharacterized protein n=1 Tax=Leptospira vanthielii serovar Holland str. Waz Holland = ATCC 700522 TaxID=1218591 RepID=N1WED8_9LEPT|nr:hypothetical protein LEP1GSC199_1539 [Leptospira vanthielii serovar Holland str. Waz Holland = ATCC 700522]